MTQLRSCVRLLGETGVSPFPANAILARPALAEMTGPHGCSAERP